MDDRLKAIYASMLKKDWPSMWADYMTYGKIMGKKVYRKELLKIHLQLKSPIAEDPNIDKFSGLLFAKSVLRES